MTRMERWLAYFSNKLNNTEMEELIMSDAAIKNAVNDTGIFMQDIEERLKYINRQMAIMDYNTDMSVSREEVREEGRTAGREEMANNIALAMLQDNKPIEEIIKYTGLTTEHIQELSKKI